MKLHWSLEEKLRRRFQLIHSPGYQFLSCKRDWFWVRLLILSSLASILLSVIQERSVCWEAPLSLFGGIFDEWWWVPSAFFRSSNAVICFLNYWVPGSSGGRKNAKILPFDPCHRGWLVSRPWARCTLLGIPTLASWKRYPPHSGLLASKSTLSLIYIRLGLISVFKFASYCMTV